MNNRFLRGAGILGALGMALVLAAQVSGGIVSQSGPKYFGAPGSGGGGAGTVIFTDNFSTYGTPSTGPATQTALVSTGPYGEFNYPADNARIENCPAVGTMSGSKCFGMSYVAADETIDDLRYVLPAGFTDGQFEWDELRSTGFDFGPTKDIRFPCFRLSNAGTTLDADLYSGINGPASPSNQDSSAIGVFIQGANFYAQTGTGDSNTVDTDAFTMTRNRVYHVKYRVKLNTPSTANGTYTFEITDTTNSAVVTTGCTSCKLVPDGGEAQQIRRFQFGMSGTNGGTAFNGTSRIYRTNFVITQF